MMSTARIIDRQSGFEVLEGGVAGERRSASLAASRCSVCELAVPRVAQAGVDETDLVEPFVDGADWIGTSGIASFIRAIPSGAAISESSLRRGTPRP